MSSLEKLLEIGERLGYKDEDLRKFVSDEQAKERNERQKQREWEAEQKEKEVEQRQKQREWEAEQQEENHQRLVELEKMRQSAQVDTKPSTDTSVVKVKVPKLPNFDDRYDNMDSYLSRFERYVTSQKIDKSLWCLHLSTLLKGKALDVYSRLPSQDAFDYDLLKAALLKRFEMTEEGFRKKFRACKPERGETFVQYIRRSKNYLDRWMQLAKVNETYEGVLDFLVRDQLLSISQKELYLFLKSKSIVDSNEMATQADLFAESRGGSHYVVVKDNAGWQRYGNNRSSTDQGRQNSTTEKQQTSDNVGTYTLKCSYCKGNHRSCDCRRRNTEKHVAAATAEAGAEQKSHQQEDQMS